MMTLSITSPLLPRRRSGASHDVGVANGLLPEEGSRGRHERLPLLGVAPNLARQSQDPHVVPRMDLGFAHRVQSDVAVLAPVARAANNAAAVAVDETAVFGAPLRVQVRDVLGRLAPPVSRVPGGRRGRGGRGPSLVLLVLVLLVLLEARVPEVAPPPVARLAAAAADADAAAAVAVARVAGVVGGRGPRVARVTETKIALIRLKRNNNLAQMRERARIDWKPERPEQ